MSSPQDSLSRLVDESIRRRGLGRLLTLKALSDLGTGWHGSKDVMNVLARDKVHNNYIFEMGGRFPALVETLPVENKVRIRPEAYRLVRSRIVKCIEEVEHATRA